MRIRTILKKCAELLLRMRKTKQEGVTFYYGACAFEQCSTIVLRGKLRL